MPTLRAFRGLFENVIRHARISAGYPIEKMIKMKLGALGIAAFAALNQSLGLVYRRMLDKYHNLFLGRWIKKVAHGARSLAPGHDGCTRIHFNGPAGVNEDDVRELLSITNEKNHNNTYRCDDS